LRETTPLKQFTNNICQSSKHQHTSGSTSKGATASAHRNILSSEERKKLFNTFMKEMNQSLLNSGGGVGAQAAILQNNASMVSSMLGKKSKKIPVAGGQMANMNESILYMR
jgi:hypothetical protein